MSALFVAAAARWLMAAFLVVMMFSLGLELGGKPPKDKRIKRHERWLLVRALVLNLVVMPLVAYALVHGLHRSGTFATAILLLAATPGGRYAPHVAKLARGELGLAVEVTLFLAKLTAFTAPVTVKWLLGVPRVDLQDLVLIAQLLFLQMLPYVVGRQLRRRRTDVADLLVRPLFVTELVVGLAFVVLLVGSGELAVLRSFGAIGWMAAIVFGLLLLGVGWLCGGRAAETRRTFAVTTAARNLGLALVVAGQLFPRGGGVQLALVGIWLICGVLEVAYAAAVRGPRALPQPA
jgi:BASS family bile acid:Na+ symporter